MSWQLWLAGAGTGIAGVAVAFTVYSHWHRGINLKILFENKV